MSTETPALDIFKESYQLSDGSIVNCEIWDTAGQEEFDSINRSYYRKADCCLLVYDITNKESFEQIKNYYSEEIKNYCKENIIVVLLGNKSDLKEDRVIEPEVAGNFATDQGYIFMETSCEKNKNVADAFATLIEKANIRMKKNEKSNAEVKKNKQLNNGVEKNELLNDSKEKIEDGNKFKIVVKPIKKKKKKCWC